MKAQIACLLVLATVFAGAQMAAAELNCPAVLCLLVTKTTDNPYKCESHQGGQSASCDMTCQDKSGVSVSVYADHQNGDVSGTGTCPGANGYDIQAHCYDSVGCSDASPALGTGGYGHCSGTSYSNDGVDLYCVAGAADTNQQTRESQSNLLSMLQAGAVCQDIAALAQSSGIHGLYVVRSSDPLGAFAWREGLGCGSVLASCTQTDGQSTCVIGRPTTVA